MLKKLLLTSLLSLSSLCSTAFAALPDLNGVQTSALSWPEEVKLGQQFMMQIRRQMPLVQDYVVNQYVQTLGYSLASNSPRPYLPFQFFIVKTPEINAFAGPAGHIGINSGLILATQSKDELAAVMAHEIAHVTQRHLARSLAKEQEMFLPSIAALLAGIALATQSPSAGIGAITATQAASVQNSLKYSRAYETEADNVGIEILKKSGYNTVGMRDFLGKLLEQHYPNNLDEVLINYSSHPDAAKRVANAFSVGQKQVSQTDGMYMLIKARLTIDTAPHIQSLIKIDQALLSKDPSNIALQYGYALALIKNDQNQAAGKIISELLSKQANQRLFKLAQASLYLNENKINAAEKILAALYNHDTHYFPLSIDYANVLLKTKQAKKALKILNENKSEGKGNVRYLLLLSKTQHAAGEPTLAYETRAQAYLLVGDIYRTRAILQVALRETKDPIDRARLNRHLKEIQQVLTRKK